MHYAKSRSTRDLAAAFDAELDYMGEPPQATANDIKQIDLKILHLISEAPSFATAKGLLLQGGFVHGTYEFGISELSEHSGSDLKSKITDLFQSFRKGLDEPPASGGVVLPKLPKLPNGGLCVSLIENQGA